MGLLISKLMNLWNRQPRKVIIVGLDNAGKTTILYQLVTKEVLHTSPTIGSNVEEFRWKNINFLMWDIGGQDSLRSSWETYFMGTEFVILVVDCTDKERILIAKDEMAKMLQSEFLCKSKILVLANKQDVKGCMSAAEISHQLNLTTIRNHPWHIQSCCALTGEGLYQGLEWMISQVRKS